MDLHNYAEIKMIQKKKILIITDYQDLISSLQDYDHARYEFDFLYFDEPMSSIIEAAKKYDHVLSYIAFEESLSKSKLIILKEHFGDPIVVFHAEYPDKIDEIEIDKDTPPFNYTVSIQESYIRLIENIIAARQTKKDSP